MTHSILIYFPQHGDLQKTFSEGDFQFSLLSDFEYLKTQLRHNTPQAIIVDIEQHLQAGLEALHTIHELLTETAIPLLAITAPTPEQRQAALRAGADDFVSAPLDWVEVQTRLRSILGKTKPRQALPAQSIGDVSLDLSGMIEILRHDLSSPATILFSGVELFQEIIQDIEIEEKETVMQLLNNMQAAISRHRQLLGQLLDWTQLATHHLPIGKSPFALLPIMEQALADYHEASPRRDLQVEVDIPPTLPEAVGDAALFQQVLYAGLDTAAKFSPPSSIIRLFAEIKAGGIEITISDEGRPLKEPFAAQIFTPQVQDRARHGESRSSVGVSLLFIRQAMEQMGGSVFLETDTQRGLTYLSLWLPHN